MAKTSKTSAKNSSNRSAGAGEKPARKSRPKAAASESAGAAPKLQASFAPGSRVTFTIARVPARPAQQKTIQRLMRMQPEIQRGLKKLSVRRQRDVNTVKQRGGRMWTNRARATKLAFVGEGESFALLITPQIIPDLRSVEKFLTVTRS